MQNYACNSLLWNAMLHWVFHKLKWMLNLVHDTVIPQKSTSDTQRMLSFEKCDILDTISSKSTYVSFIYFQDSSFSSRDSTHFWSVPKCLCLQSLSFHRMETTSSTLRLPFNTILPILYAVFRFQKLQPLLVKTKVCTMVLPDTMQLTQVKLKIWI